MAKLFSCLFLFALIVTVRLQKQDGYETDFTILG